MVQACDLWSGVSSEAFELLQLAVEQKNVQDGSMKACKYVRHESVKEVCSCHDER